MAEEEEQRIAVLERRLEQKSAAMRDLEQLLEDRTRDLYLAMERVKRQARLLGTRTAIALLAEHGTLERAAPRMLQTFGEELDWQIAQLWRVDGAAKALRYAARWSSIGAPALQSRSEAITFGRGVGLPGRVWSTGKTAWVDDVLADADFPLADAARASGIRAGCAFPIIVDGFVIAVIEMFATDVRAPDEDLANTLTALGSQIGQFIERGRALEELRDGELRIASQIQTSILPQELAASGLEVAATMLPATEVGGDYYDVLPFEGGAWFGIGDVTGHGVRAGMIMMMMQSAIAALTRRARGPREVLVELNALLHENVRLRMRADDHATLTLLRYTEDGRFVFAGAHECLLVWRRATGRAEEIATPGVWVGTRRSIDELVVESELLLEPGDILMLHTDGLTEACDTRLERFGLARAIELLERLASEVPRRSLGDVCATIVAEAVQWSEHQEDDISVVLMRRV